MKTVEITARTVDEAVKQAADEMGLELEDLHIEVLEESSKGFLGILGGKQARIKATPKDMSISRAKAFLKDVASGIGLKASVRVEENKDAVRMILEGDDLGVIIGRRGETLDAIQYLTNLVANKKSLERRRILLDAEGYRERREQTLRSLAMRLADRVKRSGQRVSLEPMRPQERRIIHTALQEDIYVTTLSEGEEPYRKVVIMPRS